MPIYLIQHGKAHSKELDADRNLNPDGITETNSVAATLRKRAIPVALICHSGKNRAQQTATIIAEELQCEDKVQKVDDLQPKNDVVKFAAKLDSDSQAMYVGHLPFLANLTAYLVTGDANRPVVKFQNSGVVCLEKSTDTGYWLIDWMLVP